MSTEAFDVTFTREGLLVRGHMIPFSSIRKIGWSNTRVSGAIIPKHQTFCIAVWHAKAIPAVLFHRVDLHRPVASKSIRETFRTGFKVPTPVEAQVAVVRDRMALTLELLQRGSGVVPTRRGYWFELWTETIAFFQKN